MSIKATQPEDSAVTDEQILALNADERFFSESPTKYPESGHGTQYHAGAPGVIGFARAVLALATPSPQPAEAVQAEPVAHLRAEANMFNGYGACHKDDVNAFPVYRSAKAEPAEAKTAAVDGDAKHGDTDGLR